jgi:hypothetical protein
LSSPHLTPIEVGFGLLKKWIQRYANVAFSVDPERILEVAMVECTNREVGAVNLFHHCGYHA